DQVRQTALQLMAIKPLIPQPHTALAQAAEQLGDHNEAKRALLALLELSPYDAANLHYRLAEQLQGLGETATAKRHVLKALEEAPRYREAMALLLELTSPDESGSEPNADR